MPNRTMVWSGVGGLGLSVVAVGAVLIAGFGGAQRCIEPPKPMVHNKASISAYRFQLDAYHKCRQSQWEAAER